MSTPRSFTFLALVACTLAWPQLTAAAPARQAASRPAAARATAARPAAARPAAARPSVERPAPARKAWLGTALAALGQVDRRQRGVPRYGGVLVERVLGDSPAGRTGIQAGDVIMRLDEKYVYEPEEIIRRVEGTPVGKSLKIDVIRNGGWLTASVKLTPRPGSVPPVPPKAQLPTNGEPSRADARAVPQARDPRAAAGNGHAGLSERLAALEREVRLLRKAVLDQHKQCRH